jgi:HTH-type transcriptional repressor of NAD biosynthesis genes
MAKKSNEINFVRCMKKGFVPGKFLPLHKGHLGLINFALDHCDFLYVIVCSASRESIDEMIRKEWLCQELKEKENISLISFPYNENILPNTSVSSRIVSEKWAKAIKDIVPDAEIVFTSEEYGDYLAEYMGISHLAFDKGRVQFPISASQIQSNPFAYWHYLAEAAKPWYVKKVAILGTESTGKSVLTEKLAQYFDTTFVPEMAREIIEETKKCTFSDLEEIANLHAKTIGKKMGDADKLLFLDTDINITKSYSRFLFNRELITEPGLEEAGKSDLYLFLEPDCPFVQDGTRLDEKERNRLSLAHKEFLKSNNIDFISISGDWKNRFNSAVDIIKKKYFA